MCHLVAASPGYPRPGVAGRGLVRGDGDVPRLGHGRQEDGRARSRPLLCHRGARGITLGSVNEGINHQNNQSGLRRVFIKSVCCGSEWGCLPVT